jgi:predicted short-subunit dehydrogenase-like oxidoreductase (DUF2520 family)
MDIAVIGAGRVGTCLAVAWREAGHAIVAVSGRDATAERAARFLPGVPVEGAQAAAAAGELVVVATPDRAIGSVVSDVTAGGSIRPGQTMAHVSGALGLDVLAPAQGAGARVLAIHPLQSFPTVEAGLERLPGSAMAVTAVDEDTLTLGEALALDAGMVPFRLTDEVRPLYHAAAVFAANYLATSMVLADRIMRAAGVDEPLARFGPLSRAVLENVVSMGPVAALTGPVARGERSTIERNLEALAEACPEAVGPYLAMARAAVDVAYEAGRLSEDDRRAVVEVLERWT